MRQFSNLLRTIPWFAALIACGADNPQTAQSAVGRNFDELARAVADCAETLASCNHEATDKADRDACKNEFEDCRDAAGKEAEEALVEEISKCEERAQACRADASTDSDEERCASALRNCIGEAKSAARNDSKRDGGAGSNAPTYQCFGQLRECIGSDKAPKECAAQARACVIAAVSTPDARPINPKPTMDGGAMDDAGRGGSGGAAGASGSSGAGGSSGASGTAGKAGAHAAGAGGMAGAHANAGMSASGAGGAGGEMSDLARMCAAEHDACVMSGEKPQTCAKDQRKCLKQDDGGDEP